jgi:hypothetical protein
MMEKRLSTDWSNISSQNRWSGLILRGSRESRIFPQTVGKEGAKSYNQYWSVQYKGTQITQKLAPPYGKAEGDFRVWFGDGLAKVEAGGWVFVDGAAFVAVRPAFGGYTWDPGEAHWMRITDQSSPVILEAVERGRFATFEAFKAAVLRNRLLVSRDQIRYTGLYDSELTFHPVSSQLPEINGQPVNLRPPFTFRSPFLQEDWASGIVRIQKGNRHLTLDFNGAEKE